MVVGTDGGRFDVDIKARSRKPIYWDEPSMPVRRCSWFYKLDGETKYVPYEEEFAEQLEVSSYVCSIIINETVDLVC